jgi:hypothetical protein
MLWVWTILLLALVAVVAGMAWLRSFNRGTRSQEEGTVPSPARDKGRGAEVKTTTSGATAPSADEYRPASTQLPVASETEETALQRQTRDASETSKTTGHEPVAASPKEPSSPATESVSVKVPSTEISDREIRAEQHDESDQESDNGSMIVSVEEAHPPVGEALPTSGSERTETDGAQSEASDTSPPGGSTVAVEQVPRVDNEPDLEKPKQDARVRPPRVSAQPGSPPTHPTQRPSRYRPPSQEPLTVRQSSGTRRTGRQARHQNFDLTVRLLFQRNGHFSLGLLPQRGADSPEEIELGTEGNRRTIAAIHDAWYEDIYPEEISAVLVDGISWEGRIESEFLGYWTLSGRDLYVLAPRELRGFTQTARLKIGREHIVLCRNSILVFVEPILNRIGCAGFVKIDESHGAPSGWTVIRGMSSERRFIQGIVPTNVVSVETGPEILSILQPEPDLEINLDGGIYLQQATWLNGFPPNIYVSGDMNPEVEVFIDGERAILGDDNSFKIQGYDTVGEHVISIPIANTSKTYRIKEGKERWTPWDAHGLSRVNLCGPLVLAAEGSARPRSILVPSSNSVILGAMPGDIAYCPRIRGPRLVGCVTFDAVWALPYDAFGCCRETTRILLLSARRLARTKHRHFTVKKNSSVISWCSAILNASRKGLLVDASNSHAPILWKEYKTHARGLWKKLKK